MPAFAKKTRKVDDWRCVPCINAAVALYVALRVSVVLYRR